MISLWLSVILATWLIMNQEPVKPVKPVTQANRDPFNRDAFNREQANQDPINGEPTCRNPANRKPIDGEPNYPNSTDQDPANREKRPTDQEATCGDSDNPETFDRESVDQEPVDRRASDERTHFQTLREALYEWIIAGAIPGNYFDCLNLKFEL